MPGFGYFFRCHYQFFSFGEKIPFLNLFTNSSIYSFLLSCLLLGFSLPYGGYGGDGGGGGGGGVVQIKK